MESTREGLKEKMFNEYGYIYCQNCFTTSSYKYEIHHIIYRSELPKHKELNNPRNLIILCELCHKWFHNKKTRRNDLIVKRKLWEVFNFLQSSINNNRNERNNNTFKPPF